MAITHVCLSDLHLGAGYSVLTAVNDEGNVLPDARSTTLQVLGTALRATLAGINPRPKLVLLGDVVDLAFASNRETALAFRTFIDEMFDGQPPVFDDEVIFVPGNHDHHLWQTVRDGDYVAVLEERRNNSDIRVPHLRHVTGIYAPTLRSRFLEAAVHHLTWGSKVNRITVAYPNYGVHCPAHNRTVVLHHGHYVEHLYRAVTEFVNWIVADSHAVLDVDAVERQNSAWIDFVWSSFGNSDRAADTAFELYSLLQHTQTAHGLTQHVASRALDSGILPLNGAAEVAGFEGLTVAELIRAVLDLTVGGIASRERNNDTATLTRRSIDGLKWYLEGPLHRQIHVELGGSVPEAVSFVFGHTHKAFAEAFATEAYAYPVNVYNTGGWALDNPTLSAHQGGAIAFITDECQVVPMQLFSDGLEPLGVAAMTLLDPVPAADARFVANRFAQHDAEWNDFQVQVRESIRLLRRRMDERPLRADFIAESAFRRREPPGRRRVE